MIDTSNTASYYRVPSFQLLPNHNGRLTLVKYLQFIFSPVTNVLGQLQSSRTEIIEKWQPFFNPQLYDNETLDGESNIKFPALRGLLLDFEILELGEEAITVSESPLSRLRMLMMGRQRQ